MFRTLWHTHLLTKWTVVTKQVRFCDFTPPSSGWLILPPPTWETRQVCCTSFVLSCPLALLPWSPQHNPVMRGQGWPVEGTCDEKGTANSFLAVKQGEVPTSFLYKMSHWPMRGCMGWLRAALKKDKVFIQPRILPKHSLLSGLDPKGLKEVPAWAFETVVSWISFRKSIRAVIACSLGVHAVNYWNVRSKRSSR